jgi:uncharacterized damage-inducible protein DinB
MYTPAMNRTPRSSDPLEILLNHDHWATGRVLELCAGLTDEQFRRSFPIGPGSRGGLCATLTHVVGAKRRWSDRLRGGELRPPLEGLDRGVPELRSLHDESDREFRQAVAQASVAGLEGLVAVSFGDQSYQFTRGVAITHVLTHGHYHRAQCLNMLRHLNVGGLSDKLPELDVVDWQYEVECGGAG